MPMKLHHQVRLKDVVDQTYFDGCAGNRKVFWATGYDTRKFGGGGITAATFAPTYLFFLATRRLWNAANNKENHWLARGIAGFVSVFITFPLMTAFAILHGVTIGLRTIFTLIKNVLKAVAELLPLTIVALSNEIRDRMMKAEGGAKAGWAFLYALTLIPSVAAGIVHFFTRTLFSPISAAKEAFSAGKQLAGPNHPTLGKVIGGIFAVTRFLLSIAMMTLASVFVIPVVIGAIAQAGNLVGAINGIEFLASLPIMSKLQSLFTAITAAVNEFMPLMTVASTAGSAFLALMVTAGATILHKLLDLIKPESPAEVAPALPTASERQLASVEARRRQDASATAARHWQALGVGSDVQSLAQEPSGISPAMGRVFAPPADASQRPMPFVTGSVAMGVPVSGSSLEQAFVEQPRSLSRLGQLPQQPDQQSGQAFFAAASCGAPLQFTSVEPTAGAVVGMHPDVVDADGLGGDRTASTASVRRTS